MLEVGGAALPRRPLTRCMQAGHVESLVLGQIPIITRRVLSLGL